MILLNFSHLEVTECPGPLGMNHSLRDPLSVKVGKLLDEDMILQHRSSLSLSSSDLCPLYLEQQRPPGPHAHAVELVSDGGAVAGGQTVHTLAQAHKLDTFFDNMRSIFPTISKISRKKSIFLVL